MSTLFVSMSSRDRSGTASSTRSVKGGRGGLKDLFPLSHTFFYLLLKTIETSTDQGGILRHELS